MSEFESLSINFRRNGFLVDEKRATSLGPMFRGLGKWNHRLNKGWEFRFFYTNLN